MRIDGLPEQAFTDADGRTYSHDEAFARLDELEEALAEREAQLALTLDTETRKQIKALLARDTANYDALFPQVKPAVSHDDDPELLPCHSPRCENRVTPQWAYEHTFCSECISRAANPERTDDK